MSADSGSLLVLVRHGQSEWNKLNLFTGWKDPPLTDLGKEEAKKGADELLKRGYKFDFAYTSALTRAQQSLDIILSTLSQTSIPIEKDKALNERNYGGLTGMNKDDARAKYGAAKVLEWRRSYDIAPPNGEGLDMIGESLEMTAKRTLPYFNEKIKPKVIAGSKVLVAAHGNSLRSIIMDLEGLTGDQIVKRELDTGVPIVYKLDSDGKVVESQILKS